MRTPPPPAACIPHNGRGTSLAPNHAPLMDDGRRRRAARDGVCRTTRTRCARDVGLPRRLLATSPRRRGRPAVHLSESRRAMGPVSERAPRAGDPLAQRSALARCRAGAGSIAAGVGLRRLGAGFRFVNEPSRGTLRLRLAITAVRAADPALDVLTAVGETWPARPDGPLSSGLRQFIDAASIEGEIRDAETNALLAEGVDRRRTDAPPIATWAQLDQALQFWADRTCARLEARTGRR